MRRIWRIVREFAWLGAFMILVLPSVTKRMMAQPTGAVLIAALRPNPDSDGLLRKVDPKLPWVSRFAPPAIYAQWWKEIADCEGVVLPVEMIKIVKFYQVNSETFRVALTGLHALGLADPPALTLIIAQESILNKAIVQHEMQHQLDYWNGIDEGPDSHPPNQFENCGIQTYYP